MPWQIPTADDLAASMSATEISRMRSAASEYADTLPAVLTRAVALVRGYVRAGGNPLGAAGTIPAELLAPVMDYVAVDVLARLGMEVASERNARRAAAIALFNRVADGRFPIQPPGADPDAGQAPRPSMYPRRYRHRQAADGT